MHINKMFNRIASRKFTPSKDDVHWLTVQKNSAQIALKIPQLMNWNSLTTGHAEGGQMLFELPGTEIDCSSCNSLSEAIFGIILGRQA